MNLQVWRTNVPILDINLYNCGFDDFPLSLWDKWRIYQAIIFDSV